MESWNKFCPELQKYISKYALPVGVSAVSVGLIFFLRKFGIIYNYLHKPVADSTRHGGELVAQVLKDHNVKYVFTLVGGHISPILVACEKIGIRVIDTRHEVTAAFAADAVARMSGSVGVCAVTAGPGLTNTVTAIKNAQMAESPLLLLGGAAATLLKGRGALQDIDQMSLFKPLCKFCKSVTTVRDIIPTLRQALQIAQSNTPGPVFVELPIDVLYSYQLVKDQMGIKDSGKGLVDKVIQWYLRNHLSNLYAGAFEQRPTGPLPVDIPMASHSQVRQCKELLARAKRPVILVGSQATLPPTDINHLRQAFEAMGIPCFLGGMSRGLLGRKSNIQCRQKRRDALREADLVILAGSVCDFRLNYGRVLSRKSKIIAVNRDKNQLYKNSDMFWKPTVGVQGDVASFIVELQRELGSEYKCDSEWIKKLTSRDEEKEIANRSKAEERTDQHLNPLKVLQIVEDVMNDNTIMVADGGDFVATAAYILRPRGPLTWLDPGAFGTLGVGGGFAIGAKLCRPESDVWIIYGDGTVGYSIAEYDTYTRHKLPIISVVGNDAGWTQIERDQVPLLHSSVACKLAFTEYDKVAEGYGGKGYKLDRSNEDKIKEILQDALKQSQNGSAVLVNTYIGKTNFREGSISI
ncbi:hypothetical protein LOTGIDRAFT_214325 [Lottia gigantea]|uniref:IlvB-like protein n=1 Tax=Lottia gigantea TaxID=225164 RepID=V4A0X9_LOTGI|nr:hypothetical protein LOTGIDRAFT_214325 [Lottia gigantea]ESO97468.1 hypothetical protein LOTGIDRAFT_214325 [Lottia gigantea]